MGGVVWVGWLCEAQDLILTCSVRSNSLIDETSAKSQDLSFGAVGLRYCRSYREQSLVSF